MSIPTYYDAILELVPNAKVGVNIKGDQIKVNWEDGREQPTPEAIQTKLTELQADYDSKQYQRDRAEAYPELKEQLDLLWHAIDGGKFNVKSKDTDFYKKLKAVKDANPKPE